ncbi:MAG: hypothetical protein JOZ60_05990 [Verrucomicrobia bacterium]|nr:hypothetical protein [Verrucomicrobiota bacterium]
MFPIKAKTEIEPRQKNLAWLVAIVADAIQIVALPFFAEGGLSPADSAIDFAAAFLLIRLLGWHWAFLPTLIAEIIPGLDLFPTWTAAVFFVTRQRRVHEEVREMRDVTPISDTRSAPPQDRSRLESG